MNKIMVGLVSLLGFVSPAAAGDVFYSTSTNGGWDIVGEYNDLKLNPACYIKRDYADGSKFMMIKDLKDGEIYFMNRNVEWNISDEPGKKDGYQVRLVFYKSNGEVSGGVVQYILVNKNTIRVPDLNVEKFVKSVFEYARMVLIMPGNIQNAEITLNGTRDAISKMSDCIDVSSKYVKN